MMVASLVYAVFVFSIFPSWTVDDALITLRYAENLSVAGELTWNVGEDPIEGYTGVALPVILASLHTLGVPLVFGARLVGIASFFIGWLLLYLILRRISIEPIVQGFTVVLYSTLAPLFTHSTSGLDTMLFSSAMLLALYALIVNLYGTDRPFSQGHSIAFFLSLLFVSLTRPEGVAFSLALIVSATYSVRRYHKEQWKSFFWNGIIWYLLPGAIYFMWRVQYYGLLLPNTFYVKGASGFYIGNVADLLRFVRRFFAVPVLMVIFLLSLETDVLWAEWKQRILSTRRTLWVLLLCLFGFALVLLLMVTTSHLLTNYSGRFYVPFLPLLFFGLALFLHIGLETFLPTKKENPIRFKGVVLVLLLLCAYQVWFNVLKLREEFVFVREQKMIHERAHNVIGVWLREHIPPSEWLLVYLDAGGAPYFSRLPTIDFGALSDEFLTRKDLSPKEIVDYAFAKNPGVMVFTSNNAEKLTSDEGTLNISLDPRFKNYTLVKKYLSDPSIPFEYHQFLYVRSDLYEKLKKEGKIPEDV